MTVTSSSPFYNVRDYGATGDGRTDDTAAIQSAFNAFAGKSAAGFSLRRGPVSAP